MDNFLRSTLTFILRLFVFFIILLVLVKTIPSSRYDRNSALHGKIQKDRLLKANNERKRIIIVGGSNVSYGIDSRILINELGMDVINTGIQHTIGLEYMVNAVMPFVRANDIVLICPEYEQFKGDFYHGDKSTLTLIFEVDANFRNLTLAHSQHLIKDLPPYLCSRLNPIKYILSGNHEGPHSVNSFNEYGDAVLHLDMKPEYFNTQDSISDNEFNLSVVSFLEESKVKLEKLGVKLLMSYPCISESAAMSNSKFIDKVHQNIFESSLTLISNPNDYFFADSLFFNSKYHPLRSGNEMRTFQLAKDLQKIVKPTNISAHGF